MPIVLSGGIMQINNIGYNYKHPNEFMLRRPNGSGDYVFILLRSPSTVILNGTPIKHESAAAIIYNIGTDQYYGGNKDTSEMFVNDWFHFSMNEEDMLFLSGLGLSLDTVYKLNDFTFFSSTIKQLCYEYNSVGPLKDSLVQLYTKLLFTKLAETTYLSYSNNKNPFYAKLEQARSTIQNHPMRDWNIDDIAASLSLSRSRVQHLYKEFFNSSITADIIKFRMERAQYYLYSTIYPISVISDLSGYDNVSCFIRRFKKQFGMTPAEYRKITKHSKQAYNYSANYSLFGAAENKKEESK